MIIKVCIFLFFLLNFFTSFSAELVDINDEKDKLKILNEEKKIFLKEISIKEKICLNRFFSSSCIEKLEIEYLEGLRRFDLKRQEILVLIKRNESKKRFLRREENRKRAVERRKKN